MIDLPALDFLTSPAGTALLAALTPDDLHPSRALATITRLRRTYPAEHVSAALELAMLRQEAIPKFGADAARLFFTRAALEQASDPLCRAYRAGLLVPGLTGPLIDAGCSIGADALAYAAAGAVVTGIDRDPVRVQMAQRNAAALGLSDRARFEVGDITAGLPTAAAIFCDPGRRTADGRRLHHVEAYQPPLSTLRIWDAPRVLAKLSPGVDVAEVQPYGGTLSFVSVRGDLKEALLDIDRGAERTDAPQQRRAVRLGDAVPLLWDAPPDDLPPRLSDPLAWWIEPDAALIRAGLVRSAGAAWDAAQVDATIAYLTADQPALTPWARCWRVVEWLPFGVKPLRAALRRHGFTRVTVKQRGWSGTPEGLIAALKLGSGSGPEAVVIVTRRAGDLIAVIAAHDA